jgi:hypothetical protein
MAGRVVIGCYRPKAGMEDDFINLLKQEAPLLREDGFLTDYPVTILHSPEDGIWVQIAQWSALDAADRAHENARVMAHWDRLAKTTEYVSMSDLSKSAEEFPEFDYHPDFFD